MAGQTPPSSSSYEMTFKLNPTTGRPFGAGDPRFYNASHSSQGSAYSFHEHSVSFSRPSEEFTPLNPTAEETPSESFSQLSHTTAAGKGVTHSKTTQRRQVMTYLVRKTSTWVLVGVALMFIGIALVQGLILPRIHTCPATASCSGSYDPNTTNAIQLLQAFMSYWFQACLMITSFGIVRLSSYQVWFILARRGNTIKNLDRGLGAIRGSLVDTCLLLFKRNNRLFSVFVLAGLGIGASISLVVPLSIDRVSGTKVVNFTFNGTSELPNSSATRALNNDGQLLAAQKLIGWVVEGDETHGGALKGSLVVPGERSTLGVNVLPGGPKITGEFECEGLNNITKGEEETWEVWVKSNRYLSKPKLMALSVALWRVNTAVASYVWVSNSTKMIPNATQSSDGVIEAALCTHRLSMIPEQKRRPGMNYLMPTTPRTSGCNSTEDNVCVADSVTNAILNWWGGLGSSLFHVTCRGGVLGPITSKNESEVYCPITQELWKQTASAMLDGIIQSAPKSVLTNQSLEAVVEILDPNLWWVQAVIPTATLLLYLFGLVYTCMLSEGTGKLKDLNLAEVVQAAQTDDMQGLIATGRLKKEVMRYEDNVGFVKDGRSTRVD